MKSKSVLAGVLWGICSFAFVNIAVPLLCVGISDSVWITANLCVCAAVLVMVYRKYNASLPVCLGIGCCTWYLLLILLALPLSKLYGIGTSGFYLFEYIGAVSLWPIICCAVSAAAVLLYAKIKK